MGCGPVPSAAGPSTTLLGGFGGPIVSASVQHFIAGAVVLVVVQLLFPRVVEGGFPANAFAHNRVGVATAVRPGTGLTPWPLLQTKNAVSHHKGDIGIGQMLQRELFYASVFQCRHSWNLPVVPPYVRPTPSGRGVPFHRQEDGRGDAHMLANTDMHGMLFTLPT